MNSRYKVYLAGELIEDEPIGLLDAELKIVRDETLNGVLFQYTTDLSFYGDGYDKLKAIANANRGCAQVDCLIQIECAPGEGFQNFFEGIIPLGSDQVDWDDYYCIVTSKVENADFSNFLKTYGDYKVRIAPTRTPPLTELCIDNITPLASITENITDFFNGFDGTYDELDRKTYLFSDALQQVLSFLSNNNITLSMDGMYNDLFRPQELEVIFPVGSASGNVLRFTFTNYYNQEYVIDYTMTGVSDEAALATTLLHLTDPAGINIDRNNYFEKASFAQENPAIGIQMLIRNYLPWLSYSIVNITLGTTGLINESQSFQYGLKNLAITSKTLLQEQEAFMYVTLNQLMEHITQMSNMGYRLIKSGTGYIFAVRRIESLILNSEAIELDNVPSIKHVASGQYAIASFTSPSGTADAIFKKVSYSTGYCYGDMYTVDGDNFSTQQFFDVFNSNPSQDDELMFFFLKDGDYTKAEQFRTVLGEYTSSSSFAKLNRYHMNLPYTHALIATRYFINAGQEDFHTSINISGFDNISTCAVCPQAYIDNTNLVNLQQLYKFEYPISVTQARQLIDNAINYVRFKNRTFVRDGFIKEVSIPFRTLLASFELYSN